MLEQAPKRGCQPSKLLPAEVRAMTLPCDYWTKTQTMLNADMTANIREYPSGVLRHRHDYTQIIIPISGAMRIKIEDSEGITACNRLAVVPDFHAHEFEVNKSGKFLVLDWHNFGLSEENFPHLFNASSRKLFYISRFLHKFFRFVSNEMFLEPNLEKEHVSAILVALKMIRPIEKQRATLSSKSIKIEKFAQLVRSSDRKTERVSMVVKDLAMSQSHFYKEFRKFTGTSPGQFQLRNTLDTAADRLACSDENVSLIAYQAGYENLASFTRIFKKHYGISPSQYRDRLRRSDSRDDSEKR